MSSINRHKKVEWHTKRATVPEKTKKAKKRRGNKRRRTINDMLRHMANKEEESENVEVVGTGMGSNVVSSNVDTAVEIDVDDEMEEPVDEDGIMTDENSDNNNIDIDGASGMGMGGFRYNGNSEKTQ